MSTTFLPPVSRDARAAEVGDVTGDLAGKRLAEPIDATAEECYWRHEYLNRDYYDDAVAYKEVLPAYRHGWESRIRHADRSWDDAQHDVRREWEEALAGRAMAWDRAKQAVRDAWDRIECMFFKGGKDCD